MRFQDKVVLVTGSSRGVGRATALAFAKEGASVVVNYNNSKDKAATLVQEIVSLGCKVISIQCDVSQEDQVQKMIAKIIQDFGKLDILVNNAAIVFDVPMFDKTVLEWQQTMATNLIGAFLCSKYAAPHLVKSHGNIVNVCSTSGSTSFSPDSADYDSSKVALVSLTKNLAKKLAPTVRVNGVSPGWIDTEMNKDLPKEYIQSEMDKTLIGRMAKPEEIANSILFLASANASYLTSSILVIDGGSK